VGNSEPFIRAVKALRLNDDEQAEASALAHGADGLIQNTRCNKVLGTTQARVRGPATLAAPRPTHHGKVLPEIMLARSLQKRLPGKWQESSELVGPAKQTCSASRECRDQA